MGGFTGPTPFTAPTTIQKFPFSSDTPSSVMNTAGQLGVGHSSSSAIYMSGSKGYSSDIKKMNYSNETTTSNIGSLSEGLYGGNSLRNGIQD